MNAVYVVYRSIYPSIKSGHLKTVDTWGAALGPRGMDYGRNSSLPCHLEADWQSPFCRVGPPGPSFEGNQQPARCQKECGAKTEDSHRLGEPSRPTNLEPAQVPTNCSGTTDHVRIGLDLGIGDSFIDCNLDTLLALTRFEVLTEMETYGVIFRVYHKHGNFDVKDGICRGSISIVRTLCRVSPSRTLYFSIEFMKIRYFAYCSNINTRVLHNHINVSRTYD